MRYAFVNDNIVKKIEDCDEEFASNSRGHYQIVEIVEGMSPEPQAGWVWDKGVYYKDIPSVTPRQIRQAMILSGVNLTMVDSALASLPEPMRSLAQTEWEYSTEFFRRRPLVESVGMMLGWNSEQLDNLWLLAGSLK